MAQLAKLFLNGGSQAVRLPKEFRLPGDVVRVQRLGRGLLLEPATSEDWPDDYWTNMPTLSHEWTRPTDPPPPPIELERELT